MAAAAAGITVLVDMVAAEAGAITVMATVRQAAGAGAAAVAAAAVHQADQGVVVEAAVALGVRVLLLQQQLLHLSRLLLLHHQEPFK